MAGSAADNVFLDVTVTPDWDWHVTYRNTIEDVLYYAYSRSYIITGVEDTEELITTPQALSLYQNFPNPFNPLTTISFDLPYTERVKLSIYDVQGRLVKTLVDESRLAGKHAVTWNGRNNRGTKVKSGVYFLRLDTVRGAQTRKIVLIR